MQTKQKKSCFAAPCKLLEKRWRLEQFEKHRRQVASAVPLVDSRAPSTYLHLHLKLKQLSLEEGRRQEIRRENVRLLNRMKEIVRSGGWTDSRNYYQTKSLNEEKRKRELIERIRENRKLLERITFQMPMRCSVQWKQYLRPVTRAGSSKNSSVKRPSSPASFVSHSAEGRGFVGCASGRSADDEFSSLLPSCSVSPAPTASATSRSPIPRLPTTTTTTPGGGESNKELTLPPAGPARGKEFFLSVPGKSLPVVRKTPTGSPARNRSQTPASLARRR